MNKLLRWFCNLFDFRTEHDKMKSQQTINNIKKLTRTHHVYVGQRGSISIVKKGKNEL